MPAPGTGEGTEIIGRYVLHGEIASGGMAVVYFGKLLGPGGFMRPVAIKRLHPQFAREPNVRDMFIDEARLASRIQHPNVVPTLDIVRDGDELLLVMEYVHGESLQQLLRATRRRNEPVPMPFVLAIMAGVLNGLEAAHEAKTEAGEPLNIVHRDVSPQNVLCGADGIPRLLDFGIARAAVRLENTQEGIVKGKLAYMAPEQLGGAPVDRRADVYAAGVVMWEMLAGRRLFVREDGASVMIDKILGGAIESPSQHAPAVPRLLGAIVLHALARDPEKRFSTAGEMACALEKFGDVARRSEIGKWVEALAGEALAQRRARLQELGMPWSAYGAASPAAPFKSEVPAIDLEIEERTPVRDPSGSRSPRGDTSSLPSPPPISLSPGNTAPSPGERVSRRPPAAVLFWGSAFMVAGLVVLAHGLRESVVGDDASSAGVASADVPGAALVPPPTCPPGMAKIPGGKFFMGSDDDLPMERPSHNVTLSPYCIDLNEVSTEQYKACSDEGGCKRAGVTNAWAGIGETEHKTYDSLCNVREPLERAKHPINCVDWDMARIYCKARGGRLPTEAEWEFAARGPDGRKYPWGDEEPGPTLLNACGKECAEWGRKNHVSTNAMYANDDGWATTSPVGSFPRGASPYGLQDIVGNVWEWVSDWYAAYPNTELVDPAGPDSGEERVIRGGAWNGAYAAWVRPTFRYKDTASKRSYGIGFRCAKSLQGESVNDNRSK
jgi:formylglycine-generating enzyme required for sulfatase activity/serine/threonine protein kinase